MPVDKEILNLPYLLFPRMSSVEVDDDDDDGACEGHSVTVEPVDSPSDKLNNGKPAHTAIVARADMDKGQNV